MIARRLAAALLIALALAGPAAAGCADPATCTCTVSASGLSFGLYDPQSPAPTDSVGTIGTSCASADPGNSTFSVALGAGSSGDPSRRTMRFDGDALAYNLYTSATRATIWSDGSGGGVPVVAPFPRPSGAEQPLNVYGRIAPRQNVRAGAYTDTIVVTVTY